MYLFFLQSYVLEIVLTLESAVDFVEDEELQPSNVNPVTPHKYSDMRPLSSSSIITTHLTCKTAISVSVTTLTYTYVYVARHIPSFCRYAMLKNWELAWG